MTRSTCSLVLAAFLVLAASDASAQRAARGRMYELLVLEQPGITTAAAVAVGGRVAGSVTSPGVGSLAFAWTTVGYVALPPVAGSSSVATGISRAGLVVGTSFDASLTVATLWSPSGAPVMLPASAFAITVPSAINGAGVVVGLQRASWSAPWSAWIWDAVGGFRGLESLGFPAGGTALDVDDSLRICGSQLGQPFVFDLTTAATTWLGSLGGGSGVALSLGDGGHVVGSSQDPVASLQSPFVWTALDGMRSLGTPSGPGYVEGQARSVDARGVVVGSYAVPGGGLHAFVWQAGAGMRDLNDLVRARGPVELVEALGISDDGWIAGKAIDTSSGVAVQVGFVLKPL